MLSVGCAKCINVYERQQQWVIYYSCHGTAGQHDNAFGLFTLACLVDVEHASPLGPVSTGTLLLYCCYQVQKAQSLCANWFGPKENPSRERGGGEVSYLRSSCVDSLSPSVFDHLLCNMLHHVFLF